MQNRDTLLDFVERLHDECVEAARKLRFNKELNVDGTLMCLYATLIEHTGAIAILARTEKRASSMAVFRTLLEAYVDFKNLLEDKAYLDFIYAQHHKKWGQILRRSKEGNPYLLPIARRADLDSAIAEHEAGLRRLKAKGIKPLRVDERFSKAGLREVYEAVYAHASGSAHNDLSSLIRRHITVGESDFGLAVYKPTTPVDFHTVLDSTARIVLGASQQVHSYLQSEAITAFDQLAADFATVQAEYPD